MDFRHLRSRLAEPTEPEATGFDAFYKLALSALEIADLHTAGQAAQSALETFFSDAGAEAPTVQLASLFVVLAWSARVRDAQAVIMGGKVKKEAHELRFYAINLEGYLTGEGQMPAENFDGFLPDDWAAWRSQQLSD